MARILYLTEGYTPHDKRFLEKIAESAHDVYFLPCWPYEKKYGPWQVPEKVHSLPPLLSEGGGWTLPRWVMGAWTLRARVKAISPHLVHAGPIPGGAFLAALCQIHPLMAMSWGSDILVQADKNYFQKKLASFTLSQADYVLADCEAVAQKAMALSSVPRDRILLLPWGVDLTRFKKHPSNLGLRERLQWEEHPILLYTRGFEPIHQPLTFLKAFQKVVQSYPDVKAILLGSGRLEPQVRDFVESHQLLKSVYFAGLVRNEDLWHYYNEANIYVSSTSSDGSSISLLEAMACGKPVVAVNAYGNREWINEDANGWMYPSGNAEALGTLLVKVMDRKSEWTRFGEKSRRIVQERADWNKNALNLLKTYDQMLGGRYG